MRPRDADLPVAREALPRWLYHVTPSENLESIMEGGLKPRSRNLVEPHPPRVYLTEDPVGALRLCRQIRQAMIAAGEVKRTWKGSFAVVGVDSAGLELEFRRDGSSPRESGVYLDDGIDPSRLRHVETVDGEALLSSTWPSVWNWLAWGRGERPACLRTLGCLSGYPSFEGWRPAPRRGEPFDLDLLPAPARSVGTSR